MNRIERLTLACNDWAGTFCARDGLEIVGSDENDDPRLSVAWRARSFE